MASKEALRRAAKKYKGENIKRIPLDVKKSFYEEIREAAESSGESVNGFIKKAIQNRLKRL